MTANAVSKTVSIFLLLNLGLLPLRAAPSEKNTPRLVVLIVVDQMIPQYFNSSYSYKDGLKTFKEQSAFFSGARYLQVPTETASGHATIVTGQPPNKTGIVGNDWVDKKTGVRVNSVSDAKGRYGPFHLRIPTIGDMLKDKDPVSKVVAVSFKERAAIMLGGHKADAVLWFDKTKREFSTSDAYGPIPSWISDFNARLAESIPWWPKFGLVLLTPRVDDLILEAAQEVIRRYDLGKDEHCDLLLVSFSATDNIGHWYGPDSVEMEKQMQNLDVVLGKLLRTVNTVSGSNYAAVLTSDHGVLPVPEEPAGKKIGARRVNKAKLKKTYEAAIAKVIPGGPWLIETLYPDIYFNRTRAEQHHISWDDLLKKAAEQMRSVPEVAQVYSPPNFPESDEYTDIYKRSYDAERSGDLYIRLKPGLLVDSSKSGTSHGTVYDYDSVVPLAFYGPRIIVKSFSTPALVEDIAPTLAALLQIPFVPSEKGKPLTDIFLKN